MTRRPSLKNSLPMQKYASRWFLGSGGPRLTEVFADTVGVRRSLVSAGFQVSPAVTPAIPPNIFLPNRDGRSLVSASPLPNWPLDPSPQLYSASAVTLTACLPPAETITTGPSNTTCSVSANAGQIHCHRANSSAGGWSTELIESWCVS